MSGPGVTEGGQCLEENSYFSSFGHLVACSGDSHDIWNNQSESPWEGVTPVGPESLRWVYLNKDGDQWRPIETSEPATIHWWWGSPLSEEQIEKLATPY